MNWYSPIAAFQINEIEIDMKLNEEQIKQFNRDGYLLYENLFDGEEMELLLQCIRTVSQDS